MKNGGGTVRNRHLPINFSFSLLWEISISATVTAKITGLESVTKNLGVDAAKVPDTEEKVRIIKIYLDLMTFSCLSMDLLSIGRFLTRQFLLFWSDFYGNSDRFNSVRN